MRTRRDDPPLPKPLGPLLEPLYRLAVARRNRAFDRGARTTDVGLPVVSVGNLSVGGTGKTPMVHAVVRWLRDAGYTPAIAMRGYRSTPDHPSDEQMEHASTLGDVPIVAQPDRVAGVAALRTERPDVDCIVLDDGFQHRFVRRDVDIVLLDATRDPFEDRCLPAGWLREPVENLSRATAVVITHAESAPDRAERIAARARDLLSPGAPIAIADHTWMGLLDEADQPLDVSTLSGARVFAVCGIGHPRPFLEHIQRCGGALVGAGVGPDHADYDELRVERMLEGAMEAKADLILTTGKDWTKLEGLVQNARESLESGDEGEEWSAAGGGPPFLRACVSIDFRTGEEDLRRHALRGVTSDRAAASQPPF